MVLLGIHRFLELVLFYIVHTAVRRLWRINMGGARARRGMRLHVRSTEGKRSAGAHVRQGRPVVPPATRMVELSA